MSKKTRRDRHVSALVAVNDISNALYEVISLVSTYNYPWLLRTTTRIWEDGSWGIPSSARKYFSLSFYANPPPKCSDTVWCINSYETELFPSTWEKSQEFPGELLDKLQKHVCINPESNDDNTKANPPQPSPIP